MNQLWIKLVAVLRWPKCLDFGHVTCRSCHTSGLEQQNSNVTASGLVEAITKWIRSQKNLIENPDRKSQKNLMFDDFWEKKKHQNYPKLVKRPPWLLDQNWVIMGIHDSHGKFEPIPPSHRESHPITGPCCVKTQGIFGNDPELITINFIIPATPSNPSSNPT